MNKRVIVVCGFGPGISNAVARRFGKEGFELALVARSEDKLRHAVARFAEEGIVAHAFTGDLSDPAATLSRRLLPEHILVGEVMVMNNVTGTPYDDGSASLTPERIASAFWQQYQDRGPVTVKVAAG